MRIPAQVLFSQDLAMWAAVATILALVLCGIWLQSHGPLRRLLVALYVFAGAFVRYVGARLRGDGLGAGPLQWRLAFERLGPSYIKLGQIIASSASLFPQRYVDEFRRCLDRVPPEPWPVVRRTLWEALGQPPEAVFSAMSADGAPELLASASIAQVYAVPGDLVIKVQRRGLQELVDADMRIMLLGAGVLQRVPGLRNANPLGVVQEFSRTLREELDFLREADHMEEFNRIMGELGRTDVVAPRPVRALCRRTVLTMERFRGIRIDDVDEIRRRLGPRQGESMLIAGMHAWFQSMIRYGFFHGDVHAGNLMYLDDGRIGFLDFGIIGRFTKERRRQIADYIVTFAMQDFHRLAGVMVRMGIVDQKVDPVEQERLAADLKDAYGPLFSRSLREIDYGEILPKIIRVSARHGTRLPDEFVLVTRQLLYFDRYAKLLAPTLNVFTDPRLMMLIGADLAAL